MLFRSQVRPLVGRYNALQLANSIIKERLSARSIENLVRNEKELENKTSSGLKKTDSNTLLVQRKIEENLGLKTKILTKKNNSGKVIIEYENIDQFEMLSKLLIKN